MQKVRVVAMVLAMGFGLQGCAENVFQDIGTAWGEEPKAKVEEKAQRIVQATVPVLAVRSVEMGRTLDGFLISAIGTAPGLGYALPRLRARRGGEAGSDGYIEYDFVAVEPRPEFELPPGTIQTRTLHAALPVTLNDLRGAAGLRVVALNGGVQMDF